MCHLLWFPCPTLSSALCASIQFHLKAFKSLFHNKSQRNGYFPPQNVWLYKGDKYKASPRFPSVFWGIINWIIFNFINFSLPLQLPNYSPYLSLSLPLSVPFMAQFLSIFPYISGLFFFLLIFNSSLSLFLSHSFWDIFLIHNVFPMTFEVIMYVNAWTSLKLNQGLKRNLRNYQRDKRRVELLHVSQRSNVFT